MTTYSTEAIPKLLPTTVYQAEPISCSSRTNHGLKVSLTLKEVDPILTLFAHPPYNACPLSSLRIVENELYTNVQRMQGLGLAQ